jgi:hypothetical protein
LQLVGFVATVNNEGAAQHWSAHIKTIKSTDVAACVTNGGAETPERSGNIVELAVETDGIRGCWNGGHKETKARQSQAKSWRSLTDHQDFSD